MFFRVHLVSEHPVHKRYRTEFKHFRGFRYSIRKDILNRFEKGESVKKVMSDYPDIKKSSLYNIKQNPIKFSLHENEIKQITKEDLQTIKFRSYKKLFKKKKVLEPGDVIRFGRGSYYEVNKRFR